MLGANLTVLEGDNLQLDDAVELLGGVSNLIENEDIDFVGGVNEEVEFVEAARRRTTKKRVVKKKKKKGGVPRWLKPSAKMKKFVKGPIGKTVLTAGLMAAGTAFLPGVGTAAAAALARKLNSKAQKDPKLMKALINAGHANMARKNPRRSANVVRYIQTGTTEVAEPEKKTGAVALLVPVAAVAAMALMGK